MEIWEMQENGLSFDYFLPQTILETPTVENISTYHDNKSDHHRESERPIIECMKSHRSQASYQHTEPHRTNRKKTPESKKTSKQMHRERKKCTTKEL